MQLPAHVKYVEDVNTLDCYLILRLSWTMYVMFGAGDCKQD